MTSNFGWFWYELALLFCLTVHLHRSFPWRNGHLWQFFFFCVFVGYPGRDRCPQWHLQECGREQVEDGQGSGQLRGSCVPPAQTGWHEPTLERPEGQISQYQVSKTLTTLTNKNVFILYPVFVVMQLRLQFSALLLLSTLERNILAEGLAHGSGSSRSLP